MGIRTEEFGRRHFIVADPGGVLIDVITEVPPSREYAEQFSADYMAEKFGAS
ncbi:hypothetical protein [Nocardia sp. Marseille-Q1738]